MSLPKSGSLDGYGDRRRMRRSPELITPVSPTIPKRRRWDWSSLKKNYWTDHRIIPAIIICLGFIAVMWMVLPDWTITRFFRENFWFILLAAAILGLTASVLPDPEIPFKVKAAKWLQVSTVVILVFFVIFESGYGRTIAENGRKRMKSYFIDSWLGDDKSPSRSWTEVLFGIEPDDRKVTGSDTGEIVTAESLGIDMPMTYVGGFNPAGFKAVKSFFRENTGPKGARLSFDEADALVLSCIVESGCNQWGPNGKVLENIPEDGEESSSAKGMFQILAIHQELIDKLSMVPGHPTYDRDNVHGQLNLALAICLESKERGLPCDEPWAMSRDKVNSLKARLNSGEIKLRDLMSQPISSDHSTSSQEVAQKVSSCEEITIPTKFGVWSDEQEIREGATLWSDGQFLQIQDDKNRTWPIPMHLPSAPYEITTRTKKVRFQSFAGSPDSEPVTVHLTPCK